MGAAPAPGKGKLDLALLVEMAMAVREESWPCSLVLSGVMPRGSDSACPAVSAVPALGQFGFDGDRTLPNPASAEDECCCVCLERLQSAAPADQLPVPFPTCRRHRMHLGCLAQYRAQAACLDDLLCPLCHHSRCPDCTLTSWSVTDDAALRTLCLHHGVHMPERIAGESTVREAVPDYALRTFTSNDAPEPRPPPGVTLLCCHRVAAVGGAAGVDFVHLPDREMQWAPVPIRHGAGIAVWRPGWLCPGCAQDVGLETLSIPAEPSSPLRGPLSAHPGTAATSLLTHGCICPCSMPRRVRCPDVLERWRSDPRAAWWEDARRTLAASHPVQAATLTEALLTATNAANEPPPERLLQEAAALPPAASVHIGWVVRRLAQHNDGYITAPCQEACLELFGGRAFAANLDRASDAFRRAPPPEPHALAAPPPTLRLQSARKATTPAPTLRMTRTTCGHRRSLATTSFLRPSRSEHALPGPAEALGGVGVGADAILPLPHPLLMRILAPQRHLEQKREAPSSLQVPGDRVLPCAAAAVLAQTHLRALGCETPDWAAVCTGAATAPLFQAASRRVALYIAAQRFACGPATAAARFIPSEVGKVSAQDAQYAPTPSTLTVRLGLSSLSGPNFASLGDRLGNLRVRDEDPVGRRLQGPIETSEIVLFKRTALASQSLLELPVRPCDAGDGGEPPLGELLAAPP
ncbi:unnamed protein product [Symbiodinium natans]|uniref:RING-type domain-containing protein n=1 Tax=Symbiodinium natans TaxID=878477 RepID=A0A812QFJ6_9DINO|nr:unnamed protein product [Symbiodinium natans]